MNNVEKLTKIIGEADALKRYNYADPRFKAWKSKTLRFLEQCFGQGSRYVKDIERLKFESMLFDEESNRYAYQHDLETAIAILHSYLEEIPDKEEEKTNEILHLTANKVFIVHGHDGKLKEAVARIIEKQKIEAIILSEKANRGRTIIEKFEDYSDVNGAVCLFTADDVGREKSDKEENARARQNVIFEAGFFMGKLGRDHVVLLADNGVEMPSDLSGVVYTSTSNWQLELLKELKEMGYVIDFNKLFE